MREGTLTVGSVNKYFSRFCIEEYRVPAYIAWDVSWNMLSDVKKKWD